MNSYPLKWPSGKPRTTNPEKSRFNLSGNRTFLNSLSELNKQLKLLGASEVSFTSNMPLRQNGQPRASGIRSTENQGCAVYFSLEGQDRCLSCDAWDCLSDNVWAIAKHIDALRGQARWGVCTAAESIPVFQLPSQLSCWSILGISPQSSISEIRAAYRRLAKLKHTDRGGSSDDFMQLQTAYTIALEQVSKGKLSVPGKVYQ